MQRRVALLVLLLTHGALGQDADERPIPSRLKAPPIASMQSLPVDDDVLLRSRQAKDGRLHLVDKGVDQTLTIEVRLQQQLNDILERYETPYAAVVALEPLTGRVLAMAEHSEAEPELRGLCVKAVYPAASVFKLATSLALLNAGVSPGETRCFHGGKRKLTPALLTESESDNRCHTLAESFGLSANVVFARTTAQYLDAERLKAAARAFSFNSPIPFPVPVDRSLAAIPDDTFELAVTGAGFGDVYLSPLHGALMAAAVANGGNHVAPRLFEATPARAPVRVMQAEQASHLADMMEQTVTMGTARRIFRERGMRVSGAVGKTGSLADKTPFRDYSWFVGFAPREQPAIAVAAVIVNDPRWRIRATWLGREAMRLGLIQLKRGDPSPNETPSAGEANPALRDEAVEEGE